MEKATYILSTVALNHYLGGDYSYILSRCQLFTTGIVAYSFCGQCRDVIIKEFSSTEMEDFLKFRSLNKNLTSVGFMDSSAIYYSSTSNAPLIVDDNKTEKVCKALDLKYILFNNLCRNSKDLELIKASVNNSINLDRCGCGTLDSQSFASVNNTIALMIG